jgi:tRNA threonylcarbamoyladenosine modification (KEOPS) complex Cgi121 subunit
MYEFRLAGLGKTVGVTGWKKRLELPPDELVGILREIGDANSTVLQTFDAERIAGPMHLVHAARQALFAFKIGENRARALDLEILRWAAAEREIKRAISKVGVSATTTKFAALCVGANARTVRRSLNSILRQLRAEPSESVFRMTEQKRRWLAENFGIENPAKSRRLLELQILERIAELALA